MVEGQEHFARYSHGKKKSMPLFSGCKGPEIVRGLKEIEHSFEKHLYSLVAVKWTALDVKATAWHDEFNQFRTGLKEMEVMLQNIINSGFENITTVEEGVELLEVFIEFTSREVRTGEDCTYRGRLLRGNRENNKGKRDCAIGKEGFME